MLKLSRSGITTLKRQYKSVLMKCLLINAGILLSASVAAADIVITGGTAYTGADTSATVTDQTINYVTKSEGDTLAAAINTLNGGSSTPGSVAQALGTLTTNIENGTIKAGEAGSLTGLTASVAELNYVDGVTSNIQTQLDGKQANLNTDQLAAANSGITSAKVSTYDGYAATIAGKQDALNTDQLAAANSGITSAKVSTYDGYAATIAGKQDALNTDQLAAANSGITSAKVSTYDGYAATIAGKQDSLTTDQLAAANSGITSAKVSTYDGYAATIAGKQDTLSSDQLAAANSGVNATKVGQYDALVAASASYGDIVSHNVSEFQAALTTDQLAAANSGITSGKVSTYDTVASSVNNSTSGLAATYTLASGAVQSASLNDGSLNINANSLKVGSKNVLTTDSTIAATSVTTDSDHRFVTDAEKTKLSGIAAGAQVNTIESIKVNGTALTIAGDKSVDITMPTKTSDLTNDSGYVTLDDVKTDANNTTTGHLGAVIKGTKVDNATTADGLTGVTATTAELNKLSGLTASTSELNKLTGVTATTAELNTLSGLTATTAELNILDGVTATTAQINYLSNVTSDVQNQLDSKTSLDAVVTDAANMTAGHLGAAIKGTKVDNATSADSAKAVTSDAIDGSTIVLNGSGKLAVGSITHSNVSDFDTQVNADIATSVASGAIKTALDTKQDNLVIASGSGLSMASDGKTLSVSGVTSAMIENGTIKGEDIGNQTITGNNLVNKTITATQIADNTITADQIAANAVTASELADDAVDTAAIQNGAVTLAKLNADVSTSTAASGDTKLMTSGGVYSIANVAAAGNYIAAGTNVAGNLSALDTAIGDMSGFATQNYAKSTTSVAANLTALDTQVKKNADDIADTAAIIGTPQTAAAGTGILTGYAINGNGTATDKTIIDAVDYVAKNAAGLSLSNVYTGATNTFGSTANSQVIIDNGGGLTANTSLKVGTTAANMLSVSSAGTVIGAANAITGTSGALDMGGNSLSNVHGLTLTDGSGHTNDATISVDANGINTGNKTLDVGTGALKSQTLYVGATDQFSVDSSGNIATSGSATVGSLAIGTTGKGFDATGNLTAGTIAATGIDTTTASKVKLGGSGYTTEVTGDLTVSGASTFGNSTGKYIDITNGALTVHDGTGTSNIKASIGNDGNIMTKGTLDVAGLASLDGGLNVNDVFDVNATTGVVTLTKGTDTATIEMTNIKDSDGNPITNVMKVAGTGLYTGYVASEQGLIVAQYNTSTGRYDEKFVVNANGNIESEGTLSVAGGKFTVDGNGAVSAANGAFTVSKDGEIAGMGLTTDATNGVDLGIAGKTTDIIGSAINIGGAGTTTANLLAGTNGVNVSSTGTDITGNFSVATNKFTVDSSNGNTTVAGTMAVADDLTVGTKFSVEADDGSFSAASGNFTVGASGSLTTKSWISAANGNFTVTTSGATTMKDTLTVTSGGADITGNSTVKGTFGAGANANEFVVGTNGSLTTKSWVSAADGKFTVTSNGEAQAQSLAFNGDGATVLVNKIDQGAAAITNGTVDTTAQQTMATNATVAKTVGNLAGLYDGTATAASHGITNVADVASAFSSLSTNVETATGGTFAGTTWTGTMTVAGATNYATTNYNDIMSAVSQVASNIGTATTTGYNGVAAGQTVNANIDALNAQIGDWTGLNKTYTAGASTGNAITNGGDNVPATVVAALNNIDATLGTIHGLSTKLEGNGSYYGNLASGTTVEQHLSALDTAIGDRSRFNNMHYAQGSQSVVDAIEKLDTGLNNLDHEVRRLRHHFEGGMASAAALSALQPNARATGDTQLAIGTGAYRGHGAMAIGGYHWFTDNLLVNVGVAHDNREATYRMGVTYSW